MSEINPGESLPDAIIKGLLEENEKLKRIIEFYIKHDNVHPLTTMIFPKEPQFYGEGPMRPSGWKYRR